MTPHAYAYAALFSSFSCSLTSVVASNPAKGRVTSTYCTIQAGASTCVLPKLTLYEPQAVDEPCQFCSVILTPHHLPTLFHKKDRHRIMVMPPSDMCCLWEQCNQPQVEVTHGVMKHMQSLGFLKLLSPNRLPLL